MTESVDCARKGESVVGADSPTSKQCSKCGEVKPLTEFYRFKKGKNKGKFFSRCRACEVIKTSEYNKRNPLKSMLQSAKKRAAFKGIDFNLVEEDLAIPETCPVLGIPLFITEGKNSSKDNAPSIDRLDNSIGYIKGNVVVISYRANRLKSNASSDEILKVGNWLANLGY